MIDIRPFASLGHANHGWLDARHHFSFANYHDPDRMGWGNIRVWNDDTIQGQSGFPPHPHRDMEIVTFVRTGAITHRDSLGNEGRTAAGDVLAVDLQGALHGAARDEVVEHVIAIVPSNDTVLSVPNGGLLWNEDQKN